MEVDNVSAEIEANDLVANNMDFDEISTTIDASHSMEQHQNGSDSTVQNTALATHADTESVRLFFINNFNR